MQPVAGKEIANRVSGMISPKHQVHGYTVGLTVKNIYSVDPTGRVDFGGSEYSAAGRLPIAAQRGKLEDKYLWWDLGRGSYFVEFNESVELTPDEFGYIEPDERLIRAGATHNSFYVRGHVAPIEALLTVDTIRLQVKQNARISCLRLFRTSTAAASNAPSAATSSKPAAKGKGKRKR